MSEGRQPAHADGGNGGYTKAPRAGGSGEARSPGPAPGDAFHPDLPAGTRLYRVGSGELTDETAQSAGMRRFAAISGKTVGSEKLWMGRTHVGPSMRSADHHHGESETAIYVVSGHPRFVFLENDEEVALETEPGDYIFVPPYVPHREENPDPEEEAVVVIARSTQEAIVINLESLADTSR